MSTNCNNKDVCLKGTKYISTPYYRTILPSHSDFVNEAEYTYTPYDLFVIETRLYPLIYKMFFSAIKPIIYFEGVEGRDKMNLKIVLKRMKPLKITDIYEDEQEIILLTDEQATIINNKLNEILVKHKGFCLIDINELYLGANPHYHPTPEKMKDPDLYRKPYIVNDFNSISISNNKDINKNRKTGKYPYGWFYSMIQYVDINSGFNPFIREEGLYVSINPSTDFNTVYSDLTYHILSTIFNFYQSGVIHASLENSVIVDNWELERLDLLDSIGSLYKPNWTDERFASNPVDFMLSLISNKGLVDLKLKISENLVTRHNIAVAFKQEFIFEGNYIKIKIDNLNDAREAASLVESIIDTEGEVITFNKPRMSWMYLYSEVLNEMNDVVGEIGFDNENNDVVIYKTNNIENPFTVSYILPSDTDSSGLSDYLTNTVMNKLENLQTKYPDINVHDLIENNYVSIISV